MKLTSILILALALCVCLVLPVSAEWMNGKWITSEEYAGYNIVHDSVTGVDSKYRAVSQETQEQQNALLVGTIKVIVRSGYNTLTPEVGVRNNANPDGANGTFKFYPIQPDGIAEIEVIPGNFTLYIPNSNGGQDEFAHVTVAGGKVSPVAMLGHAVSGSPEKVAASQTQCTQKIIDVTCKVYTLTNWYDWKQYLHINADYPNQHYNALFGDPDYGTLKELRIVYKYEKWGWSRVLVIKSAQYGTFCGETKLPKGYFLKSVAEDVDMDIHYPT